MKDTVGDVQLSLDFDAVIAHNCALPPPPTADILDFAAYAREKATSVQQANNANAIERLLREARQLPW